MIFLFDLLNNVVNNIPNFQNRRRRFLSNRFLCKTLWKVKDKMLAVVFSWFFLLISSRQCDLSFKRNRRGSTVHRRDPAEGLGCGLLCIGCAAELCLVKAAAVCTIMFENAQDQGEEHPDLSLSEQVLEKKVQLYRPACSGQPWGVLT